MKKLIVVLMTGWISLASAEEQIGQISCHTLNRPVSYVVRAEIFGTKSGAGLRAEYVNIHLTSYNWETHKESAPLRTWQQVPNRNDRHFSEHFQNEEVALDAYYDDVGAMSSITYEGEEHQLACEINFNEALK